MKGAYDKQSSFTELLEIDGSISNSHEEKKNLAT